MKICQNMSGIYLLLLMAVKWKIYLERYFQKHIKACWMCCRGLSHLQFVAETHSIIKT